MKNSFLIIVFSFIWIFGFSQNFSIELQAGAQIKGPVQDYFDNRASNKNFSSWTRFGIGMNYEFSNNWYAKLLLESSTNNFKAISFRTIEISNQSIRFDGSYNLFRDQMVSSLIGGYDFSSSWIFVEGGLSIFYTYNLESAVKVRTSSLNGTFISDVNDSTTENSLALGYVVGFGIKADGTDFTNEKLHRFYMKYSHSFSHEFPTQPIINSPLEISEIALLTMLTFGIRI